MIVDALAREVGAVGLLLHKLRGDQWQGETRCPPMTVFQLSAHVLRGASRIREILGVDPVDEPAEKDAITYWAPFEGEQAMILSRAQDFAAEIGSPKDLVRRWDEDWGAALRLARASDLAAVRPTPFGLMRGDEYLRTRCVEVLVHHMDLDDAVGKQPHPDPACLQIVGDVLRGLLGTDLRSAGVDDVRLALVGTGRADLTPDERAYLGPLAEKFPLLS